MRLPKLHTRDDEEPDIDVDHMIEPEVYNYRGCWFCGHEDHRTLDCVVRRSVRSTS